MEEKRERENDEKSRTSRFIGFPWQMLSSALDTVAIPTNSSHISRLFAFAHFKTYLYFYTISGYYF